MFVYFEFENHHRKKKFAVTKHFVPEFDASELYFPDTFNSKPVLTGLFILNQTAATLEEAKSESLKFKGI